MLRKAHTSAVCPGLWVSSLLEAREWLGAETVRGRDG